MANMLVCQYASEKECELSEQDTWLPLLVGRFCSVSVNMTQHCAHPLSLCESLSRWPLQSCASGTCYSFSSFSIQEIFRFSIFFVYLVRCLHSFMRFAVYGFRYSGQGLVAGESSNAKRRQRTLEGIGSHFTESHYGGRDPMERFTNLPSDSPIPSPQTPPPIAFAGANEEFQPFTSLSGAFCHAGF